MFFHLAGDGLAQNTVRRDNAGGDKRTERLAAVGCDSGVTSSRALAVTETQP